jgi:hypothetical protein
MDTGGRVGEEAQAAAISNAARARLGARVFLSDGERDVIF